MNFFEQKPQRKQHAPEQSEELPPQYGPRGGELGAVVPVRAFIYRSPDTAITLTDLVAYSTGFAMELAVYRRVDDCLRLLDAHHHFQTREQPLSDKALRFGIEYSDGRRASNIDGFPDAEEPSEISLMGGSGGGGGYSYRSHYWAWPLPPPGPIKLAVEWPIIELPVTQVEIDSAPILDTAARSERPWNLAATETD